MKPVFHGFAIPAVDTRGRRVNVIARTKEMGEEISREICSGQRVRRQLAEDATLAANRRKRRLLR